MERKPVPYGMERWVFHTLVSGRSHMFLVHPRSQTLEIQRGFARRIFRRHRRWASRRTPPSPKWVSAHPLGRDWRPSAPLLNQVWGPRTPPGPRKNKKKRCFLQGPIERQSPCSPWPKINDFRLTSRGRSARIGDMIFFLIWGHRPCLRRRAASV